MPQKVLSYLRAQVILEDHVTLSVAANLSVLIGMLQL